mgnify:FL=1
MTSRRTRTTLASALLLCLQSACSGQAPTVVQTPAPSAGPVPSDGVVLRDLGVAHGPATFWLPATPQPQGRIDEPNVVTLTYRVEDGASVATWLAAHLTAMGFVVDAYKGSSLVFHEQSWQGAYTCSSSLCALTLRQERS